MKPQTPTQDRHRATAEIPNDTRQAQTMHNPDRVQCSNANDNRKQLTAWYLWPPLPSPDAGHATPFPARDALWLNRAKILARIKEEEKSPRPVSR